MLMHKNSKCRQGIETQDHSGRGEIELQFIS